MRIYFDLDSSKIVETLGVNSPLTALSLKRGDSCVLDVLFTSGGNVVELDPSATGKVGLKAAGDFSGNFIANAASWVKTGTLTSTVYRFTLNLATDSIAALLTGSTASVSAIFEMEFAIGTVRTSSQTIPATIYNDVIKGGESGAIDSSGGTPVNGAYATVTITPSGSNNVVVYTSKAKSYAANSITIAYAAQVTGIATVVSVVGTAITITPCTIGTVNATGATPALATCYAVSSTLFTSDGVASNLSITGVARTAWFNDGAKWNVVQYDASGLLVFSASSTSNASTPAGLTYTVGPGSGTLVVTTGGITTAANVIAAVNANAAAAALVTAAPSGTVTGTVNVVSATSLAGGVTQTAGYPGSMMVDSTYLYVLSSSNLWVAIPLASLSLSSSIPTPNSGSGSPGIAPTAARSDHYHAAPLAAALSGTALPISLVLSYLTTVGTLTVGTWNATVVAGQYGGTGIANTGKTITLGGSFLTSSAIQFNCTGSLAFVGPTTGCTFTLPSSSAVLARTDAAQTFAGVQSFSSVPVFSALTRTSVYLNAAQTLTVSVYDIVKFDTVEFGSGFNTGTNTYTVPYTGHLKVTGAIGVNVCSGGLFVVTVYNGSTRVKRCFSSNNYMSGSINPFSVIIPVTAADSITIRVYSSPAAQLFNNSSDTWCQFEMLPN